MTVPFKKIAALTLILLNLAVVVTPHLGHEDEWVNAGTAATLRSHDCGANEIHKDLKDHSDCLLCSRTTLFVAFVIFGQLPVDNNIAFRVVPTHETHHSFESASAIFLRGPPALIS
jgi:hypothetical protein